ncbi:MAG: hypothetical protein J6T57_00035 [Alphaproteobacteria bacterium]|nr:hypothetical protein [Alphaproteobacteria bacterium]
MAEVILFGVPYGFQNSECDADSADFLGTFYIPRKQEFTMNTTRRKNKVYYSFLVNEKPGALFNDINGRPGSFFGISLVFDNKYVTDTNRLNKLFATAYNKYVKNHIIQEYPNGNRRWLTRDLDAAIKYVGTGMQHLIDTVPELQLSDIVKPLPQIQPQNLQMRR